jgi:hypothetical protein
LRRVLQSLACAKKKVLKKLPAGKDVHDDDVFKFNAEFDDPRPKVHINSIQVKVSVLGSFLSYGLLIFHSLKNLSGQIDLSRMIGSLLWMQLLFVL